MGIIISTIIKYSFYGAVLGIGAGSFFLHKTLPSNESFDQYISKDKSWGVSWAAYIATKTVLVPQFKSYLLFKTAELTIGNKRDIWIGIANNWYPTGTKCL